MIPLLVYLLQVDSISVPLILKTAPMSLYLCLPPQVPPSLPNDNQHLPSPISLPPSSYLSLHSKTFRFLRQYVAMG